MTQKEMIARLFGHKLDATVEPLPKLSVERDSIDDARYNSAAQDSPTFRERAIEDKPRIVPNIEDPPAPDMTTASQDEIAEWQKTVRANKEQRDNAELYDPWEHLARDTFNLYHHIDEPSVLPPDQIDPTCAHHAKIAERMAAEEDCTLTRNITRDNPTLATQATLGAIKALKEYLGDELVEQARQSQEVDEAIRNAENAMDELESLRDDAQAYNDTHQPVPPELIQQIKDAVKVKRDLQGQAADIALQVPVPMTQVGHDACVAAGRAARETAERAKNIPGFGQGYGEGEPHYESPEQALSIAEKWANDPTLREVAKLYGRMVREMEFERANRVEGGQDEIVDLKFGDDLRRVAASELTLLGDPDYEDDFFNRYVNAELLVYDTVGEEHAGRGPVVMICDESSSMRGMRNFWSKALCLSLLSICRREKRDFAYIAFAGGSQAEAITVKARDPLSPETPVHMGSHFYGGGTIPVNGLALAEEVMQDAEFRKADIVMLSDGEADFGNEDRRLRNRMAEMGVRFHGIGIGGSFSYLSELTDDVIDVLDFQLEDPGEAVAHLATHLT